MTERGCSGEEDRVATKENEVLLELITLPDRFVVDRDASNATLGVLANENDFFALGESVGATSKSHGISHGDVLPRRVHTRLQNVTGDRDLVAVDIGHRDSDDGTGFLDVLGEGFADFLFELGGG